MTDRQSQNLCCVAPDTRKWWQKLVWRAFPYRKEEPTDHLEVKYKLGFATYSTLRPGWADRIRILLGANLQVKVVTGTHVRVDDAASVTTVQVLHPLVEPAVRKPKNGPETN